METTNSKESAVTAGDFSEEDEHQSTDQVIELADEASVAGTEDEINIANQHNVSDVDDKPLSKNQLKKMRRHERWLTNRLERRKVEREKRKQKRRQISADCKSESIGPPANKTRKMDDPEASDVKVVIDCSFDQLMNIFDIKKLVKQLQRCYAENRRVEKPLQYYVCNFKDKTKDVFENSIQGYKQWDVNFEGLDPEAKFGKDKLVFLAAESPNILQNLDSDKVYIIGGLVDHNHHKGVCYQHALDRGWEHAQLPIGDNVQMKSRKVLAVNHVFEILLQFVQCNDWQQTISHVIPLRKQVTEPQEEKEENQSNQLENREIVTTDQKLSEIACNASSSASDTGAVNITEGSKVLNEMSKVSGQQSKDLNCDAQETKGDDIEDGS